MIAVLSNESVEHPDLEIAVRRQSLIGQKVQRDQRGLRGVSRTDGHSLPLEGGDRLDAPTRSHQDDGAKVAVAVAHANGFRATAETGCGLLRLDPGERRVPRDVHVSQELRFDLPLVVRVEDIVEGQTVAPEVLLESIPNRDDFLVVRYGSHD